jgi:hemerythrin-like domain-containing protein
MLDPINAALDDINALIASVGPVASKSVRDRMSRVAVTLNNVKQYGWTVEHDDDPQSFAVLEQALSKIGQGQEPADMIANEALGYGYVERP